MIHLIKNANGTFDVVTLQNGVVLNHTNQRFERKAGAYKNMRAVCKVRQEVGNYFQDDTLKEPAVFFIKKDGIVPCAQVDGDPKPEPKYQPGKNKK